MKKILFTLTCFVLAYFATIPFGYSQKGLHLGVRLAPQGTFLLNQNDMDEGKILDPRVKFGFMGGIGVGYHFLDFLGAEVDILYSGQGSKAIMRGLEDVDYTQEGNYSVMLSRNLSYVKIPVLLKLNTSSEARVMGSFFLGPQFSFLTGASSTFEVYEGKLPTSYSIEQVQKDYYQAFFGKEEDLTKEQFKSNSIDFVLGFGVDIKLSDNMFLNANIRLDYGLTDVEDKTKDYWKVKYYPTKYSMLLEGATKFKDDKFPPTPYVGEDPYEYYKLVGTKLEKTGEPRSAANNITAGFQLGFTYVLPFE